MWLFVAVVAGGFLCKLLHASWKERNKRLDKDIHDTVLKVLCSKPRDVSVNGDDLYNQISVVLGRQYWAYTWFTVRRVLEAMEANGLLTIMFAESLPPILRDEHRRNPEMIALDVPFEYMELMLTNEGRDKAQQPVRLQSNG